MTNHPIHNMLVCIILIAIAFGAAYSQSTAGSRNLENLSLEDLLNVKITTVSKTSQKAGQAPATVIVVTAEQIRIRGYRNLAQILNDLPDFKVDDKSDPQFYNPVSIRGIFRQDYFVILLDGVRVSSPTNEPLPLLENFPVYLARQIEVVYGPGSALYGADAMAGVINIITEKEKRKDKLVASSMTGTHGYSSNTLYLNKVLKNNFKLVMAGQYSYDAQPDFSKIYKDAYNMTSHQTGKFNSAYGTITPDQPVDPEYKAPIKTYNFYSSLEKGGFHFKFLHHYAQVPSSTTLKPDDGVYNKDVFYGHGVTIASAGYADSIGKIKSVTTFVGSFYKVNPKSNFRNVYGRINHGYKYSTGSMLKAEEQLSLAVNQKIYLVGGLTYELFQSIPKSPELQMPVNEKNAIKGILLNTSDINNPRGIQADFSPILYNSIGTYFQFQYTPINKLGLTAGMRYDNNSRFGATFNPRVGAVLNSGKKTIIKALYGTAYWAPSPLTSYESYGSFYSLDSGRTYQSGFWHLPNPSLKPVTSNTAELSVNRKIGKKLSATLTGYHTRVNNIIKNVPDAGNTNLYNNQFLGWNVGFIVVPFNLGSQNSYGGTLMINSLFNIEKGRFNAWSSVSYVEGKVQEFIAGNQIKKIELPLVAPWQFRLGLDCKWADFYFSTRLQVVGKQRVAGYINAANPDKRQTISGYSLLNGSAGYTLKNKLNFFVTIENALDQRYRNPLPSNLNDTNVPAFAASFQDPLRVMGGIRLSLEK